MYLLGHLTLSYSIENKGAKVPFFIHCNKFSNHKSIFEYLKKFIKFSIVGKSGPGGVLKWKIFWKKGEVKLKKMRMKIFNSLFKIATACKILSQKLFRI